jgi:NADPH:quinone reductase
VSSAAKAELAAAAGADHVINYREQDVAAEVRSISVRGIDSIVEVAAGVNAATDAAVLAEHGSVAMYAAEGHAMLSAPIFPLMVPNGRWQFVFVYTAPSSWKSRAIDDITDAISSTAVQVGPNVGLPLHHFPLEYAPDAYAAVKSSAVGKVLIDVTD